MFYYLSRVRRRTLHAQVTHVITGCVELADETIAIRQVEPQIWDHMTVWSVAKSVLTRDWATATLYLVDHANKSESTVRPFLPTPRLGICVYPGAYKRPSVAKSNNGDGPPLPNVDRAMAKPRRPDKGGVKKVPPKATVLIPMMPVPPVDAPALAVVPVPPAAPEPEPEDEDSSDDSDEVLAALAAGNTKSSVDWGQETGGLRVFDEPIESLNFLHHGSLRVFRRRLDVVASSFCMLHAAHGWKSRCM